MQVLTLETRIAAPVERCFLLSLSIDLHQDSAAKTEERAIAGVTRGIIGAGDSVRFRGRHFGLMLEHESVISGYEYPSYFQDSMVRGAFHTFVHDHFFERQNGGTLMRDVLRFSAPLGLLGEIVERLMLRRHLDIFLRQRNEVIRSTAEAEQSVWRKYVGPDRI